MLKQIKVEARSIPYLYLLVAVPLIISIFGQFGFVDLTPLSASILTILSSLFVLSEVGAMGILRGQKLSKDPIRMFGALVGIVALLGGLLSLVGFDLIPLTYQGIVNTLVVVYILVEGFR